MVSYFISAILLFQQDDKNHAYNKMKAAEILNNLCQNLYRSCLTGYLIFSREIAEIFVNSVEFVFAVVDGIVAAIVGAVLAVRSGIALSVSSAASAASSAVSAVAAAGTAVGGFVTYYRVT